MIINERDLSGATGVETLENFCTEEISEERCPEAPK
jgi:hypothetical protein